MESPERKWIARVQAGVLIVNQIEADPRSRNRCAVSVLQKTNVVTEPRYLDLIWTTALYCWPCFPTAVTFAGSGVMLRILQQGTHQLREFRVRQVVLWNYFFAPRIASFAGLKTLNLITVLAENFDLLLLLWIGPGASFPLVFYELPKSRRDEFPFFLAAL